MTRTDTRRGYVVFLIKLTDRGSSNLSVNDLHWFNITKSYKWDKQLKRGWSKIVYDVFRSLNCEDFFHWKP